MSNRSYFYGGQCHSSYGGEHFNTPEEAYKACQKSRIDQILAGYEPKMIEYVWEVICDATEMNGEIISYSRTVNRIMEIDLDEVTKMSSDKWHDEMMRRFLKRLEWKRISKGDIDEIIDLISMLNDKGYLTNEDADSLMDTIRTREFARVLSGSFTEGNCAEVNVNGTIGIRKVRYSKSAGDLYVIVDGKKYFYCEFDDMTGDDK